ncbi:MAG: hypothetical protein WAQ56_04275 [Candidatus Nitrotoga sp.]
MEFIDVYFSPKQISNPVTFSPSPRKPALVVADWIEKSLPIRIIDPVPVTREQIAHAHNRSYVDGVLDCDLRNGFCGPQRMSPNPCLGLPAQSCQPLVAHWTMAWSLALRHLGFTMPVTNQALATALLMD